MIERAMRDYYWPCSFCGETKLLWQPSSADSEFGWSWRCMSCNVRVFVSNKSYLRPILHKKAVPNGIEKRPRR